MRNGYKRRKLKWQNIKDDDIFLLGNRGVYLAGDIVSDYNVVEGGVEINEVFVPRSRFVFLNEKIDYEQEKEIIEIIKKQLKQMFWSLYTKSSVII